MIWNTDSLPPWFFIFALAYGFRSVLVNQDGLKLNGTHQLVFDADDVNILGGNVHTVKKNTDALVVASKGNGLQVNADKSKYRVTSWESRTKSQHRLIIVPLKGWHSSNIWEQPWCIKILFGKKLRAYWSQGMLAIIWCRIFCLAVCYLKI